MIWTAVFLVLNLADGLLTRAALAMGGAELNPVVAGYGANLWVKVALGIVATIWLHATGKPHLIKYMAIFLGLVIIWNSANILAQGG